MSSFWANQTIKAKMLLGIGAILVVFAVSSAVVSIFVNNLAATADHTLNGVLPIRSVAYNAQIQLTDADDNINSYMSDPEPATQGSYLAKFKSDIEAVKSVIPSLGDAAQTPQEHTAVSTLSTSLASYLGLEDHAISLKRAGKYAEAIRFNISFGPDTCDKALTDYISSVSDRVGIATKDVAQSSRAAVTASIAGALIAIAIGAAIAFALGGSISKRLTTVTRAIEDVVRDDIPAMSLAMSKFAAGDLSARVSSNRALVDVAGKDETAALARSYNNLVTGVKTFGSELSATGEALDSVIGEVKATVDAAAHQDFRGRVDAAGQQGVFRELGENLNRLMDVVSQTVSEIKDAAEVVSTSAAEISAGNNDLSQRTEEQAASLEETAASMEELTATVNQNAENAKQANSLAIGASEIALRGGHVVGEVVATMSAINESGKKIVDIISVIDGIAFQTNILALNAAVEAARAGEQGRGFAVVAGEVRTLAQRSAAAAKEIKSLIGDSVEKTNAGTILVGQAGATMTEIVSSVKRVTEIMSAIAGASLEQGSGIGQVNDAVAQMDQVTQQNAALVEEIAASAASLEERARGLVAIVAAFRLVDNGVTSAPRPRPEPAIAAVPRPARHAGKPSAIKAKKAGVTPVAQRSSASSAAPDGDSDWSSF